jgi:hypothetical protein
MELLDTLLNATDAPLAAGVAGCTLLLYAQPIPRILAINRPATAHLVDR